jgi:hypothetical protein
MRIKGMGRVSVIWVKAVATQTHGFEGET